MLPKPTRKATIAGLEKLGYTRYETRVVKYLVFHDVSLFGTPPQYLVGRSGALRVLYDGATRVEQSISITGGRFHCALCELGSGGYRPESREQALEILRKIQESI